MPTVFTHAFVGGMLASGAPAGISRVRLAVTGVVLATLPDIDVIAFLVGIPYGGSLGHRGLSHSFAFASVLALLTARICFPRVIWWTGSWCQLAGLLMLAAVSHGVLDAFTDGGLGVGFFIPFSSGRYFFPWRPLAVSPIGVGSLFTESFVSVLFDEFVWIWLPIFLYLAAAKFVGGKSRRSA
jgi:inner membrane protein